MKWQTIISRLVNDEIIISFCLKQQQIKDLCCSQVRASSSSGFHRAGFLLLQWFGGSWHFLSQLGCVMSNFLPLRADRSLVYWSKTAWFSNLKTKHNPAASVSSIRYFYRGLQPSSQWDNLMFQMICQTLFQFYVSVFKLQLPFFKPGSQSLLFPRSSDGGNTNGKFLRLQRLFDFRESTHWSPVMSERNKTKQKELKA